MIKKRATRKFLICSAILFAIALVSLFPNSASSPSFKQELSYTNTSANEEVIYLLDRYNMIGRTKIAMAENPNLTSKTREIMSNLISGNNSENNLPNGFKNIIPTDTKILSLNVEDKILKINFSREILNIKQEYEEKMIEAIVYTATEIDGIDKIIIYVEGDVLTKLPKSKKNLPATLDRSFGINKEYNIKNYKNIKATTVYYINKFNDDYYYVPVTKYSNDSREKIKIIIEELKSSPIHNSNLMSFLNSNTILLATEQEVNTLFLVFNEYIFSDMDTQKVLEEVVNSISLSVKDNYGIDNVVFKYKNEEICKTTLKSIE